MKLTEILTAIEKHVDDSLLTTKYVSERPAGAHKLFGHCYVATEVVYHLWGKQFGFKPHVMKTEKGTHWFLAKGDVVLDPTSKQFPHKLDYTQSKGCGFLTSEPSKRAQILMERIGAKITKKVRI